MCKVEKCLRNDIAYMYIYSEHQTTEITNGTQENGLCKPEDENTTDQELLGIPEFNQANQVGEITFCALHCKKRFTNEGFSNYKLFQQIYKILTNAKLGFWAVMPGRMCNIVR